MVTLKERVSGLRDYYAKDASRYDEDRFGQRKGRLYNEAHYRALRDMIRAGTVASDDISLRVLDIATGTGRTSVRLADEGFTVCGLDITPEMLYVALGKKSAESKLGFCIGDAFSLPFADNSFDVVLCCRMLQMIPREHYDRFGREVSRVISPEGILVVELWNKFYQRFRNPLKRGPNTQGIADTFVEPGERGGLFGETAQPETLRGLGFPLVFCALGGVSEQLSLGLYRRLSANRLTRFFGETMLVQYRNVK